jgi:hypothetical protein
MFAVLVGRAVRFTMSAEQPQQTLLGAADLNVRAAMVRRLDRLGEVEGEVHRDQRVERERKEAESRGPDPASPLFRSHSGRAGVGGAEQSYRNGKGRRNVRFNLKVSRPADTACLEGDYPDRLSIGPDVIISSVDHHGLPTSDYGP